METLPLNESTYCCTLMDEIFPPYICAHGPGEDPFEAVMCTVGPPRSQNIYGKKTLMSVFTRVVNRLHNKTTIPLTFASYEANFSANATFNRSLQSFFFPLDNCFEWDMKLFFSS